LWAEKAENMLEETEPKKKNETVIKSEHTKLKVATGYILLLSVVLALVYITYNSFYKIINSVESLGNSKTESTIAKNLASGINELRTASIVFSIAFKSTDYSDYLQKKESVYKLMDSLTEQLSQNNEFEKADTLNRIFKEYIQILNNWLTLKKADNANDFGRISEIIKEQTEPLNQPGDNFPHLTTTTVTRLMEKPAGEDSAGRFSEGGSHIRKTFFQKIFGSRKKYTMTQPSSLKLINRQTTSEIYTRADTGYYNKVNLILSKIRDTVTTTENIKEIRKTQISRLEILILNYQSALATKIDHLLNNIEKEDRTILNKRIFSSKQTAKRASEILVYAELVALIISLVFVYVIFTDLTKSNYYKLMLEKEKLGTEKLARAKEDFLATMSHEIRTPLTNIIGISEQLENTPLKENQEQYVKTIVNSSEHLLAIVNDILDFSKIESDSIQFERIGFCINDIVAEAMEILRLKAGKKGLQLFYQPRTEYEKMLFAGDPFRLKQVLINLISNGIKFTEKGHIRIEAFVTESKPGYLLRCNVEDTGIGIDEDKLETIFTDFSQADSSISRKYGGTGLGLPISKRIVEMQNGSIRVKSKRGQGSVFSFEIPYLKADKNEYSLKHVIVYEYGDQLKNKKVLVIDDDVMMSMIIEPMLLSWNMDYTFCSRSVEAWNMLQHKVYDIILLDIQMTGMDGFVMIRRIRTDSLSKNKTAKIVVCTANVVMDTHNSSDLIFDSLVLYKPFKKAELWNILCKSLDVQVVTQAVSTSPQYAKTRDSYSLKNFAAYANEDTDTLVLFINTFISQTKKELAEMQNCFLQKDFRQVLDITHKLKNTFGQLEANEPLVIITDIETLTMTRDVDVQRIENHIVTLNHACMNLFTRLEKETNDLKKT
jgi:signal transduction histidine kinase/DNA-binding response OmpR family regulator